MPQLPTTFLSRALLTALLPVALLACTPSPSPASAGDAAATAPAADPGAMAAPDAQASAQGGSYQATTGEAAGDPAAMPSSALPGAGAPGTVGIPGAADAPAAPPPAPVTAAAANATLAADSLLRAQVLLERAYFSPGEIDGKAGSNMRRAVTAYQRAHELSVSGELDDATWAKLNADTAPILVTHTLTADDVAGPFAPTPDGPAAMAELDALPYNNVEEKLGERFHASPALLASLNPGVDLSAVGTQLTVLHVAPARELPALAKVIVDKSDSALLLEDADGRIVGHFPVTTGSAQFPLPIGDWKINGVARDPVWHFDPKLIAGTAPDARKAEIPPGPNNPVGTTWIDLSKEHYGIHGTPNPGQVGKNASNGCIRMTNWSVAALANAVKPGVAVTMRE